MLYDITAKDLCKYYPVYTKAGFIWKNRINWEVIQVAGNKVKTYFGIFTFLRAYKVDKVWYWVLTDGTNNITIKRDQARRNKKLPRTATITTALMLAQPKELIDQLVEQVERLVKQYNEPFINNPANYTTKGKLKSSVKNKMLNTLYQFTILNNISNIHICKISYISMQLQLLKINNYIDLQYCKKIYKQLTSLYHPDRNCTDTTQIFQILQQKFMWLK